MSGTTYRELRISKDLRRFLIPGPGDLLRRWIAGRELVLEAAGEVPLNTWDRAPLEFSPYQASREELDRAGGENVRLLASAYRRAQPLAPEDFRAPSQKWLRAMELAHQASMKLEDGEARAAEELARQALAEVPGHPVAARLVKLSGLAMRRP